MKAELAADTQDPQTSEDGGLGGRRWNEILRVQNCGKKVRLGSGVSGALLACRVVSKDEAGNCRRVVRVAQISMLHVQSVFAWFRKLAEIGWETA